MVKLLVSQTSGEKVKLWVSLEGKLIKKYYRYNEKV